MELGGRPCCSHCPPHSTLRRNCVFSSSSSAPHPHPPHRCALLDGGRARSSPTFGEGVPDEPCGWTDTRTARRGRGPRLKTRPKPGGRSVRHRLALAPPLPPPPRGVLRHEERCAPGRPGARLCGLGTSVLRVAAVHVTAGRRAPRAPHGPPPPAPALAAAPPDALRAGRGLGFWSKGLWTAGPSPAPRGPSWGKLRPHPAVLWSSIPATCGPASWVCGRWFWKDTPPRACPRHSHPALDASSASPGSGSSDAFHLAASPTPLLSPTLRRNWRPLPTQGTPSSQWLSQICREEGLRSPARPPPSCPALLRVGDPGSTSGLCKAGHLGFFWKVQAAAHPAEGPDPPGGLGSAPPLRQQRPQRKTPVRPGRHRLSRSAPPPLSHPCTRTLHTRLHTYLTHPCTLPRAHSPPLPPLHQEKWGNGSQAAPTGSCCRTRSQDEGAEEGRGSRRFAAGAGRGRGRAESEAAVAWATLVEGVLASAAAAPLPRCPPNRSWAWAPP